MYSFSYTNAFVATKFSDQTEQRKTNQEKNQGNWQDRLFSEENNFWNNTFVKETIFLLGISDVLVLLSSFIDTNIISM